VSLEEILDLIRQRYQALQRHTPEESHECP
jgi:hypothetical protein